LTTGHHPEQTGDVARVRPALASARGGEKPSGSALAQRRAALLLQDLRLTGPPPWWVCFEILGDPVPWQRAGTVTKGQRFPRWYTPKETLEAERAVGERIRYELRRKQVSVPLEGPLALITFFYRSTLRAVDEDNLRKLVLDGSTHAGVWGDDKQVTAGAQMIELDREHPRTLVALCPHDSSMRRAGKRKPTR